MNENDINAFKAELNEIFTALDFRRCFEYVLHVSYHNKDEIQCDFYFKKEEVQMFILCYHEFTTNQYDRTQQQFDTIEQMLNFLADYDESFRTKVTVIIRRRKLKKLAALI